MLHLAILWHQHQPLYGDLSHPTTSGSYVQPWVRLHAIRDYYSMAAIAAEHPEIHVTINLTPVLLWQLDDYLAAGATDTLLDLTRREPAALDSDERDRLLAGFFDADWHNQIFPHPRYRELFLQRREGRSFAERDLRDLQMWPGSARNSATARSSWQRGKSHRCGASSSRGSASPPKT